MNNRRTFKLILLELVIILLIVGSFITFSYSHRNYINKEVNQNNILISYPFFDNKMDNVINTYLKGLDSSKVDKVKYYLSTIDNKTSILFKLYHQNLVVDYQSFIFNDQEDEDSIDKIVDKKVLLKKAALYAFNNKLRISDAEIDKAKINIYLKQDKMDLYLTDYNEEKDILYIPLDYNELKGSLKIKIKYNQDYSLMKTTTTTTTTKSIVPKKLIAFTFDDGPSIYTLNLLDILDEYGAKATFFEVGYNIAKYKDVTLEVYKRGFEVGNHTMDHSNLTKYSIDVIKQKINDNNALYYSITGQNLTLLRPPYGRFNDNVKASITTPIITWDVDTEDWKSRNTDMIVAAVIGHVNEGDIVLFHDIYPTTIEAIKIILPILYQDNYQIVGVSELFKTRNITLEPAQYYRSAR